MAHLSVVQAVEARLTANFDECPIYVENSFTGTPDEAGPWMLIDFPWCRSEWVTASEFLEEGGFRVLLAIESATGTHQARQWLDDIAALFRGQAFSGVQFYAPQSPVSDDQSDAGVSFVLTLTVPYQTLIIG